MLSTPAKANKKNWRRAEALRQCLLYAYFRAISECHADVSLAIDRHEVHERPPKPLIELRQCRVPTAECLAKSRERLCLGAFGLDSLCRGIVLCLHRLVAADQFVVSLLILRLVLGDAGILADAVLHHVHQHLHLVCQFPLLGFKARCVTDLLLHQLEIFDKRIFFFVKPVESLYED